MKSEEELNNDASEREESVNEETNSEENSAEETESVSEDAGNSGSSDDPEKQLAELNDKYVRLYSDFDNFRRRTIKEKADIISSASSDVVKEVLAVLDDFERAIENNKTTEDVDKIKEGFELIHNKLFRILSSKGLESMEAKGEKFDPEKHEAVTNIPAPSEDDKGKVLDVIEKGYKLNGKPIRYAKVVVGQ